MLPGPGFPGIRTADPDIAAGVDRLLQKARTCLLQERHSGVHVPQLGDRLALLGDVPANDLDHRGRGTTSPFADTLRCDVRQPVASPRLSSDQVVPQPGYSKGRRPVKCGPSACASTSHPGQPWAAIPQPGVQIEPPRFAAFGAVLTCLIRWDPVILSHNCPTSGQVSERFKPFLYSI